MSPISRIRNFFRSKYGRLERVLNQAVPKEGIVSGSHSDDPYLELDVMFDPPASQLILYYFISLSFQKSLGLQVRNLPNQEILVSDWLITSHLT